MLTDFNAANLAALLGKDDAAPAVLPVVPPFAPIQAMVSSEAWSNDPKPDAALIWTRPDTAVPMFRRVLAFEHADAADVRAQVDEYCDLVLEARNKVGTVLVATWTLPSAYRGLGVLDLQSSRGTAYTLGRMNLRLAERLSTEPGVFVLNAERWIHSAGGKHNPKLWYLAKVPFSTDVFAAAVSDIKAALRAKRGAGRKLLVLDLDHTLWGGIVGDTPWEQLRLGGHDAIGEAYQDFQRALKALARRGVVLAIVSKNEEAIALEAIRSHPEMILREADFAAWRINWTDKAANIAELVADLRLSLDATVFIDDSAIERERVRSALPDVCVPDWPADPMMYAEALWSLPWFDTAAMTSEDELRAQSYAADRERSQLRELAASDEEWRRSLDVALDARPFSRADLPRVAQLLNKTNQMNLSTRRLGESELLEWLDGEGRELWTFRLCDRFGDYGLVGLLTIELEGADVRIVDFILSCRAFGREVERAMLSVAAAEARAAGAGRLLLTYHETPRNQPCLRFLRSCGLVEDAAGVFSWSLDAEYSQPPHIAVQRAGTSELAS